ncbi:MAG: hypothetical protein JW800_02150 [Candidatus Omnitrophica bacterium]|nr:hypothetical protein [Candidatus Omnitrophota bacterium]
MTREESKKIVKELHEKYYGKKGAKSKVSKRRAENTRIAERIAPAFSEKSRNDLMLEAKAKGIKNFRILNKEELVKVLDSATTQEEQATIIKGAVERWKSGWSKNKVTNNKG